MTKTMGNQKTINGIVPAQEKSVMSLRLGTNDFSSQSNDLKITKTKTSSTHYHTFYSYTTFLFHLIFSLHILLSFILKGSDGKVLELSDRYVSLFGFVFINN